MIKDLNALLVFAKVVEAHSFSEAARRLKMPISTVSRRIVELEDQLGVRLLERSTRNLRLTELGAEVLEQARQVYELSDVAKMKVWSRGKYLPARFVLSIFCGQLVDTSIFYIFALGTLPASVLTNSILLEVFISVAVAAVCLPVSRAVSSWLKRTENVDVFDYATDFNPLRF